MRNFGRGMWRRVDDYEKTPKFKESQYFAFLEYQKVKEMQKMVNDYRTRIVTAINNITNVEPALTITEVIEDNCKQEIIVEEEIPVTEEILVPEEIPVSEETNVTEAIPVSEEIIVTEDVPISEEIPVLKETIVTESDEIPVSEEIIVPLSEDVPKPKKGRRKNK